MDAKHRRWVLLACLIGMFSVMFPATILTISIASIAIDLHSQPATVTWVTTAPLLAAAVATPVLGRLGDLRGHRLLYVIGMIVAGTFAVLTAMAWSAASLIIFRTLSQVGAAATVPASFAILFRCFPAGERVRAASLASGVTASAAAIGVVIGGPLVDWFGWRPIFLAEAVLVAAALTAALIVLPRDRGERVRIPIDLPGAIALAVTIFALTFGINRLGVWGLNPISVISLIVFPIGLAALILIEKRSSAPLLPLQVLSQRNTQLVSAVTFLLGASWMGNFVITPLLLESVMGFSAGSTSAISVPRAGFVMLAAPVAARLGTRFGERKLIIYSATALAVILAGFALGASRESAIILAIALPLSGWAFGHTSPALVSSMGHAVTEEDFGLATSLQQTSMQIGQVVGIGLFTSLAANAVTSGPYVRVYLLTAALAMVAVLLSLGIRDGRKGAATSVDVETEAKATEAVAI